MNEALVILLVLGIGALGVRHVLVLPPRGSTSLLAAAVPAAGFGFTQAFC